MLIRSFPVPEITADIDQRKRNPEPETQKRKHCSEGNGTRRMLAPNKKIEEKTRSKNYAGVQSCSLKLQKKLA